MIRCRCCVGDYLKKLCIGVGTLVGAYALEPSVLSAVSAWLSFETYEIFFGRDCALGVVIALFCHEMGHVLAARIVGVRTSLPYFVPMLGAVVCLKRNAVARSSHRTRRARARQYQRMRTACRLSMDGGACLPRVVAYCRVAQSHQPLAVLSARRRTHRRQHLASYVGGRYHLEYRLSLRVGAYHIPAAPYLLAVAMVAARSMHRERTSSASHMDARLVSALIVIPRVSDDDNRSASFAMTKDEI